MKYESHESAPEREPSKETQPLKIIYKVMLIDYFESEWIDLGKEYDFENKDLAIQKRDKCNLREFKSITPSYDHYGVIEMKNGVRDHEIDCPATFKSE